MFFFDKLLNWTKLFHTIWEDFALTCRDENIQQEFCLLMIRLSIA